MANSTNPDLHWIENSGMSKGSLGRKAKKSGMSTMQFAKDKSTSPGKLGKQSRLAETLSKLRRSGAVGG